MRKWMVCLLAALLLAGCGWTRAPKADEAAAPALFIAIANDCPQGVQESLRLLCDRAAELSAGKVRIHLQYWDDPLRSGADMAFFPLQSLSGLSPLYNAPRADYLFSSQDSMSAAMNAAGVLEELSGPLAPHGFEVLSAFYLGRQYLLSFENDFTAALRTDNPEQIAVTVQALADGGTPLLPFPPQAEGQVEAVYYAGTLVLYSLPALALEDYTLIDAGYRYNSGLLCKNAALADKLAPAQLAYVYEAAAEAKPACDAYYLEADKALRTAFPSVIVPSLKLARAVRGQRENRPASTEYGPLRQKLAEYNY